MLGCSVSLPRSQEPRHKLCKQCKASGQNLQSASSSTQFAWRTQLSDWCYHYCCDCLWSLFLLTLWEWLKWMIGWIDSLGVVLPGCALRWTNTQGLWYAVLVIIIIHHCMLWWHAEIDRVWKECMESVWCTFTSLLDVLGIQTSPGAERYTWEISMFWCQQNLIPNTNVEYYLLILYYLVCRISYLEAPQNAHQYIYFCEQLRLAQNR